MPEAVAAAVRCGVLAGSGDVVEWSGRERNWQSMQQDEVATAIGLRLSTFIPAKRQAELAETSPLPTPWS